MDHRLLLQLWEGELRDQVAEGTAAEYRRYVHKLRQWLDVELLEAEPLHVRAWLADHGWSPATRHYALRAVRHFFRWAVENELTANDPTAAVKPPKVDAEAPVRTSTDEVRDALVAACNRKRDVAFVELLHTGPRFAEVARLHIADVHLDEGYVEIHKTEAGRPRQSPIVEPRVQRALRAWLTILARRDDGHDKLWVKDDGRPMSGAGLMTVVRRTAERAGVEFGPHDGRR